MNLRPRLIPILLMDKNKRLVKTINFGSRTYIGDPINVIRLFNEKMVDEIVLLDIDASSLNYEPDYEYIAELASECFIPMAYGGGIKRLESVERLISQGCEKVVLRNSIHDEKFIKDVIRRYGSQAVIACVDYQTEAETYLTPNSSVLPLCKVKEHIMKLEKLGVGEIILQCINRDGKREGYDLKNLSHLFDKMGIPLIALGGCGNITHIEEVLKIGFAAASGSAFCFYGPLRAVLVNYPSEVEIANLEKRLRNAM